MTEVERRRRRGNTRRTNKREGGREGRRRRRHEEGCRNSAPASLDLRVSRRRRRRRRQGGLIFYASFPPLATPLLLAAKETSTNFVSPSYRTKPSWLLRPATWRRLWADAVQVAYRGGEFDSYFEGRLLFGGKKKEGRGLLRGKYNIFFLIISSSYRSKLAEEFERADSTRASLILEYITYIELSE